VNIARTAPRTYADYLRAFRRRFIGRSFRLPGSRALVRTSEGVNAVDEAIRFLSNQRPLPPLSWSKGLAAAAADLVVEEGSSGTVGHTGNLSGTPRKRIERHGTWQGEIGESIFYGPGAARFVVMQLIIDDGVSDRGHRKSLFTRAFRLAGVSCGPHPRFGKMCVIDFATVFARERSVEPHWR
jgi:uncharacterized protein YkwD